MSILDIASLEAEAAQTRAALKLSARELHRRLSRDYLIDLAVDRIAGDAASVAGEVVGQVKENGGKAALFGAGLLLAFGAGRGNKAPTNDGTGGPSEVRSKPAQAETSSKRSSKWDTFFLWAGGLGAAGLSFTMSNLVPVSATERELLGDLPVELKKLGADFIDEHLRGAKQLFAGSLGIASYAAGALGLMAAFATWTNKIPEKDTAPGASK